MWNKVKRFLEKNRVLIVVLCLTVLARIPSLFEPYWYGDEAIYLTIGQAVRAGVPLYSGIHDNKPPFLYLLAALAGGNQYWFKFIAGLWVLATIVIFYKLAQKVFEQRKWATLATGVFAFLVCWPKLEGNIANAELFFLLPTLGAAYLLWHKPTAGRVLIAGISLGLGAMFKMPAVLEAGVWPVIWLVSKDRGWWKKSILLGIGILIPIGISMGYFGVVGSLREYFTAAWAQNLPYLSSWKAPGGERGIYSLSGRAIFAGIWAIVLLVWSKKQGSKIEILGLWSIIVLFAALLSGRPYPHYLMQTAGVMAMCLTLVVAGVRREKVLGVVVIGIFLAAIGVFKFYNYPVLSYYKNFGEWVGRRKNQTEYFAWFNSQVNDNYRIAKVVRDGSDNGDKIFVWGDEPMIYAVSKRLPVGKYTVYYHIKDFRAEKETLTKLQTNPPKYIVSFGKEDDLPGLALLLAEKYLVQGRVGRAVIYRYAEILGRAI